MILKTDIVKIPLLVLLLLFAFGAKAQKGGNTVFIDRYKIYLLDSHKDDLEATAQSMSRWPALDAEGKWPDINYSDNQPGDWNTVGHLRRLRFMALLWASSKSPLYHSDGLMRNIHSSLKYWLAGQFKNPNWWHNEIGVPQIMRDVLTLVIEQLTADDRKGALMVYNQYVVRKGATGANLVWSADLAFHYGVFTDNHELMRKSQQQIVNEIKITTDDGIQPDYSFHQHGARLQMYEYGRALFWESTRLAWEWRDTEFAFPAEKLNILKLFVINGWQWMARGINTVPGTIDRSITRKNELHSSDIRVLMPYLMDLFPQAKPQFKSILDVQAGRGALSGFKYFPYSDFSAYQQKNYSVFVKTLSTRTLATESINNENLKGQLLNSGDTYYVRNGREYFNLAPVWNWNYLPGITTFKGAAQIRKMPFTGSVANANSGLTVMDYVMTNKDSSQSIHARKFWAFHSGLAITLIAEVDRKGQPDSVVTVLDQSRLQGKVWQGNQYLYHNKLAYYSVNPQKLELTQGPVTGSWRQVDGAASDKPVIDSVFLAKLIHPNKAPITIGYGVSYFKDPATAKAFNWTKAFKVILNTPDCQAIRFADETVMAAFYKPLKVKLGAADITVNKPCAVLLAGNTLYVSDPTHKGGSMKITYHNNTYVINTKADGTTTQTKL